MKVTNNIQITTAALVFLAAATPGFGNIISSYTLNGNGTVTYSYIVDNAGGAFDIASWSLDFDFPKPDWNQLDIFSGGEVSIPNSDWFAEMGIPIQGRSAQDFLALAKVGDVAVGATLGEFSFTSTFLPGTIAYNEFSADGESFSGATIGPISTVPESNGPFEAMAIAAVATFAATIRGLRRPVALSGREITL